MKTLTVYFEDNSIGVMPYTDLDVVVETYLYGGEEKEIYGVYVYFEGKMIFATNDKKEIIHQGNKLFIYNF